MPISYPGSGSRSVGAFLRQSPESSSFSHPPGTQGFAHVPASLLDQRDKVGRIRRFSHMHIEAGVDRTLHVLLAAPSGDGDQQHAIMQALARGRCDVVSENVGQTDVEDADTRRALFDQAGAVLSV